MKKHWNLQHFLSKKLSLENVEGTGTDEVITAFTASVFK